MSLQNEPRVQIEDNHVAGQQAASQQRESRWRHFLLLFVVTAVLLFVGAVLIGVNCNILAVAFVGAATLCLVLDVLLFLVFLRHP